MERLLPGEEALGVPLPKHPSGAARLTYKLNGHLAFWASMLAMTRVVPTLRGDDGGGGGGVWLSSLGALPLEVGLPPAASRASPSRRARARGDDPSRAKTLSLAEQAPSSARAPAAVRSVLLSPPLSLSPHALPAPPPYPPASCSTTGTCR